MTGATWGPAAAAEGDGRTVQAESGADEAAAAAAAAAAVAAAAAAPAGPDERKLCCSPDGDGDGLAPGDWRCGGSGDAAAGGGAERAAGRSGGAPGVVGSPRSGPPPCARVRRCAGAASGSGSAGSGRWW